MISDDLGFLSRHRAKDRHLSFMPGVSGDVCDDSLVIFLCKDISGNPIKQVSCSLHTMAFCTMIIEELFSCGDVGMIMLIS